jgi:hypothetical protein
MATICTGNGDEHCCWINGVCEFLEENTVPGRRWACGLRRELGSWQAVHADSRYLTNVHPVLARIGDPDCGDWPAPGVTCAACGACDNG